MFVKSPSTFVVKSPLIRLFQLLAICLAMVMAYVCLFNLSHGYVAPWIELSVLLFAVVGLYWEQTIQVSESGIDTQLSHGLFKKLTFLKRHYPVVSSEHIEVSTESFGYMAWYDRSFVNEPLFYSGSFIDNQH